MKQKVIMAWVGQYPDGKCNVYLLTCAGASNTVEAMDLLHSAVSGAEPSPGEREQTEAALAGMLAAIRAK